MSVSTTPTAADLEHGESAVRRQMAAAARRIGRLKKIDRAAVGIITLGGIAVIISVIGILVFIGAEALPLFTAARAAHMGAMQLHGTVAPGSPAHAVLGVDESVRYVYDVTPSGTLTFFATETGKPAFDLVPRSLKDATITTASRSLSGDFIALGTSDGRVALLRLTFVPVYEAGVLKNVTVDLLERAVIPFDAGKRPLQRISYVEDNDNKFVAGQVTDSEIKFWWADPSGAAKEAVVQVAGGQKVTALKVSRTGTVVGTDGGDVYHWEFGDTPTLTDVGKSGSSPVTALNYVIGGHTFIVGTQDGRVSAWFRAPVTAEGTLGLVRAADFEPQGSPSRTLLPPRGIARSPRPARTVASSCGTRRRAGRWSRFRARFRPRTWSSRRAVTASWLCGKRGRSIASHWPILIPKSAGRRSSARSGTRATASRSTFGSRVVPTTLNPSSASCPSSSARSRGRCTR